MDNKLLQIINKFNIPQEDRNYLCKILNKENNNDIKYNIMNENNTYIIDISEYITQNKETTSYRKTFKEFETVKEFNNEFKTNLNTFGEIKDWFYNKYHFIKLINFRCQSSIIDLILTKNYNGQVNGQAININSKLNYGNIIRDINQPNNNNRLYFIDIDIYTATYKIVFDISYLNKNLE